MDNKTHTIQIEGMYPRQCLLTRVPNLVLPVHLFHGGDESHAERCDEIGNAQADQHGEGSKFICEDAT